MKSTRSKTASNRDYCPLLRLAPELRNMVFHYALTTEEILDLAIPKSKKAKPRVIIEGQKDDFNQLKFVSRQLYNECAGLEVMYNPIVVRGDRRTILGGPARRLSRFLETCSPAKVSWFAQIVLVNCNANRVDWVIEPASDILPVADLCRANPNLHVDYFAGRLVSPDRSEGPQQCFLRAGTYMLSAVRHKNAGFLHIPYFDFFLDLNEGDEPLEWTDEQGVARLDVPNLRFFPDDSYEIDESFGKYVEYILPWVANAEVYEEEVTRYALDWDENGI